MIEPLYVIGDIHGQLEFLEQALAWIEADGGGNTPVIFVGDLVDRGPDSRGVIAHLEEAQRTGRDWTVLRGNHDRLFVQFCETGSLNDGILRPDYTWLHPRMGGRDTLAAYGIEVTDDTDPAVAWDQARSMVPPGHVKWLSELPLSHETGTHFFAHAGINPANALDRQSEDDLLWIRKPFHDHPGPHPKIIVHGHTPVDLPMNYGHRINVDGGAGQGRPIYPVLLEGGDVFVLTETGRALI